MPYGVHRNQLNLYVIYMPSHSDGFRGRGLPRLVAVFKLIVLSQQKTCNKNRVRLGTWLCREFNTVSGKLTVSYNPEGGYLGNTLGTFRWVNAQSFALFYPILDVIEVTITLFS